MLNRVKECLDGKLLERAATKMDRNCVKHFTRQMGSDLPLKTKTFYLDVVKMNRGYLMADSQKSFQRGGRQVVLSKGQNAQSLQTTSIFYHRRPHTRRRIRIAGQRKTIQR